MLLRFRCKNFRSIREEQELSLIAAKTRTDERSESLIATPFEDLKLLRCAAIYGANASGKSNVLAALSAFSDIVSESQRLWRPSGPIPRYDPFVLDDTSSNDASEFEIVFLLDSSIFRYGFRFNRTTFLREWLVDATSRDKVLFHRESEGEDTQVSFPNKNLIKSAEDARHLEGIRKDVRPNSLFYSASAQRNHLLLTRICSFLTDGFDSLGNYRIRERAVASCREEDRRKQVLEMLRFADVGIRDLSVSSMNFPEPDPQSEAGLRQAFPGLFPNSEKLEPLPPLNFLWLSHAGAKDRSYLLKEVDESGGTLAYLSILGPLLDRLRDGGLLLIDELESSLHPALARELVRIFNSPKLNPKGAQVIFTTHNTNLLDMGLLRRDQVWFTEKNREGATRLFPLTDYQPRTNQNIEAGYLGGRFGAIPFLDEQLLRESLIPSEPAQTSLEFSSEG